MSDLFGNHIVGFSTRRLISQLKNLLCGLLFLYHYENLPMRYTEIFIAIKMKNFRQKNFDIILIFAQNIDCGYTLEPPR